MRNGLPPGWTTAPLADLLITLESGSRPRGGVRGIQEGIPSVGGEHLTYEGAFDFSSVKYVPKEFAAGMTRGQILPNDILVVKDGATTGKTAFADPNFPYRDAVVNEHVFICRPTSQVEPRYLFRFLMSKEGQQRILENFKGSAQGGINQTFAQNTEVPLAPLAEQCRIVAKLEQLLAKVNASRQRLANVPVLLKRFRQSVLAAACSGRLTADWRGKKPVSVENLASEADVEELPIGWKSVSVGDVIEDLKYGTAQKCSYEKRGVPVLRIPNLVNGTIDHADLKYAELPPRELEQLRLHPGDILMIRSNGSVSLVGKCALVRDRERGFAYAGYLIRIRPRQSVVDPEFFRLAIGSYNVRLQIELQARSTSGVHNINTREIQALRFSLPPLVEQREVVHRAEVLFALADQIETRCTRAKTHADALTQSILAKAFHGELVAAEAHLDSSRL